MNQFKKYVANTAKATTFNTRGQNIAFRLLGMIRAVGHLHKYATQEGKRFPNALRDFEYHFEALCQLLKYEKPEIEADENPTYTLPDLTDQVFKLSGDVFRQLDGKTGSLKPSLDAIEKSLVNLYVVYNKALTFNDGEGITRERLLTPN